MNVLILDDQPGLAETLALSLRHYGYSALAFTSANKALEAIGNYDVLVTDYHMPQMTGLEVAQRAYSQGWRGPFILMSGRSTVLKEIFVHPFLCQVLQKPFSRSGTGTRAQYHKKFTSSDKPPCKHKKRGINIFC